MVSKKLLLIFSLVFVGALLVFLAIYKSGAIPTKKESPSVAESSLSECVKNFDIAKLDPNDRTAYITMSLDDELAYMLRNFKIMESLSGEEKKGCVDLENKEGSNPLIQADFCQSRLKNIQMLNDFAGKMKQKVSEKDFMPECQNILLQDSKGFKEDVPENLWEERSNLFCKDIYLSYQKGVIVLGEAFENGPSDKNIPTCDCFDEDGKERTCQNDFCGTMEFFVAISKNNQSLCPKLSEFDIGPFCNLYFDTQFIEKYKNMIRDRYCQKK
jgi:hypothetical protein